MGKYEPKVMFYNAEKGAPLPGEPHKTADGRASIPVEVLFNDNSSSGEVTPLKSGTVAYTDQGVGGAIEFQEGENMVLGHVQLSARPGVMDMSLANQYADRLVVPLGQERQVRPEGIKATKAVIAANPMIPNMDRWDGARLERHLAYGDEIYERQAYAPTGPEDWKNKAMTSTGAILCGDVNKLNIDGALLFDLHKAAGGSFTGPEIREQYENGGSPLGRVPAAYQNAHDVLTTSFAAVMGDAPYGKQDLSRALAKQWDLLDEAMGGMNDKMPAQIALMHVACNQMGWDFIPTPENAAKLEQSLADYQNGDEKGFERIIEASLSEHPQPEYQVGFPERDPEQPAPKKASNLDRMRVMMPRDDKADGFQFEM